MTSYLHITYICIWAVAGYIYTSLHSGNIVLGTWKIKFYFLTLSGICFSKYFWSMISWLYMQNPQIQTADWLRGIQLLLHIVVSIFCSLAEYLCPRSALSQEFPVVQSCTQSSAHYWAPFTRDTIYTLWLVNQTTIMENRKGGSGAREVA